MEADPVPHPLAARAALCERIVPGTRLDRRRADVTVRGCVWIPARELHLSEAPTKHHLVEWEDRSNAFIGCDVARTAGNKVHK